MLFLKEFYNDSSIIKNLNRTFVALIPKVDKPISMKDFRPISLIGPMYKVLAKVLANRLKGTWVRLLATPKWPLLKEDKLWTVLSLPMKLFILGRKINKGFSW